MINIDSNSMKKIPTVRKKVLTHESVQQRISLEIPGIANQKLFDPQQRDCRAAPQHYNRLFLTCQSTTQKRNGFDDVCSRVCDIYNLESRIAMLRPLSFPAFMAALAAIGALFSSVRGEMPLDLGGTVGTTVNGNVGISSVITEPSAEPSAPPTLSPSKVPSVVPSRAPSVAATAPTRAPTRVPTAIPTKPGTFVGRSVLPIDLGVAEAYAILAGSTVTSTGTVGTVITGNIGIFPGSAITGFPPAVLNGALSLATGDSAGAQIAMTTAYISLASRAFNTTLTNQNLGGMTLIPGVYKFVGGAAMNGILTLDARGDAAAVWIFQIGSVLNVAQGSSVVFKNNFGNPDYVYWQVGTAATIGIGVPMVGNILAFGSIILNDGVTVKGRCLARNAAVTLDRSVVTLPAKISFRVTQNIVGLSLEQYNANAVRNAATLKEAIAASMSGIVPADIKNLEVSAGSTTSASARAFRSFSARALATNSIVLDYDVIASSTATAQELQNQLKSDVSDGGFNTHLHAAAVEWGATDLLSATSDSVDTETNGEEDTSGSKSVLSDGAIVGIAIGGFFALVLLGSIIFHCNRKNSSTAVGVSTQEV